MAVIEVGAEVRGFRIEAEIGRGGMGVVYLAEQLKLGRKVALKVMSSPVLDRRPHPLPALREQGLGYRRGRRERVDQRPRSRA